MAQDITTTPPPVTSNPSATGANLSSDAAKQYIQSQIADKQAQVDALTKGGDTSGTTDDLTKNPDNSYSLNNQGQYNTNLASLTKAMSDYTTALSAPNPADVLTANVNSAVAGLAGKNAAVPVSIVKGQQARLLAQNQPQEALLNQEHTSQLAGGLQAIKNQQTLLGLQPNNPANLKSAADLANTEATTKKTLADLDPNSPANQLIKSEIAKNYNDIASTGVNNNDLQTTISNLNTYDGQPYITPSDLASYTKAQQQAIKNATPTTPVLTSKEEDSLNGVMAAKTDLQKLSTAINDPNLNLPKDMYGQPQQYANAKWNDVIAANPTLASFDTWKLSVIPILNGLKGSGTGGGAARLFNNAAALFPSKNDTLPQAQKKLDIIYGLLDSAGSSIMGNRGQVTIGGNSYKPGDTISDGKLTLTVNSDKKTLKGSDGNTYDLQGNIIK